MALLAPSGPTVVPPERRGGDVPSVADAAVVLHQLSTARERAPRRLAGRTPHLLPRRFSTFCVHARPRSPCSPAGAPRRTLRRSRTPPSCRHAPALPRPHTLRGKHSHRARISALGRGDGGEGVCYVRTRLTCALGDTPAQGSPHVLRRAHVGPAPPSRRTLSRPAFCGRFPARRAPTLRGRCHPPAGRRSGELPVPIFFSFSPVVRPWATPKDAGKGVLLPLVRPRGDTPRYAIYKK